MSTLPWYCDILIIVHERDLPLLRFCCVLLREGWGVMPLEQACYCCCGIIVRFGRFDLESITIPDVEYLV